MGKVFKSLAATDGIKEVVFKWQRIRLYIANPERDGVHLVGCVCAAIEEVDGTYFMSQYRKYRNQNASA
jgi:hypothetical protein